LSGEPIAYGGGVYYPSGPITHFNRNEMVESGSFDGVPIFVRPTMEIGSVIFVPLAGGLMRPYEQRRAGDLAGTSGSTAPNFVVQPPQPYGQTSSPPQFAYAPPDTLSPQPVGSIGYTASGPMSLSTLETTIPTGTTGVPTQVVMASGRPIPTFCSDGKAAARLDCLCAAAGGGRYLDLAALVCITRAEIEHRFHALTAEFNSSTNDGLGPVARAARLGQYFTEDVVIELGAGSPPIHGGETLIGMAARRQPRTAAFVLELSDIQVQMFEPARAGVTFTAVIQRRSAESSEDSMDAREFSAEVRQTEGEWRISRVTAVETLRK
jgi:SnoaL-like domain